MLSLKGPNIKKNTRAQRPNAKHMEDHDIGHEIIINTGYTLFTIPCRDLNLGPQPWTRCQKIDALDRSAMVRYTDLRSLQTCVQNKHVWLVILLGQFYAPLV